MARSLRVGDELFQVYLDAENKVNWFIYKIRTIRGGKTTAICKNKYTWINKGKSSGGYGWAESIPSYYRETWVSSDGAPDGIATTKKKAIDKEIASIKRNKKRFLKNGWGDCFDYCPDSQIKKLKAMRLRIKK